MSSQKYIYPVWYAISDYVTTALAWTFFFIVRGLLVGLYYMPLPEAIFLFIKNPG
jgi:hypothetical protein